ncbi:hypothetical protein [Flavivirga jejuensis]|uniref:DUF2357 domain-containing protein n=1 Tax=Flavivirga jejuensis TaxID=870487 RepID=A0ABT8WPJ3_9FLAO|nr:hypothetical protein [Flavivirga jejuensis]MDO5974904.1 hypothetical protein [Flavivirga jejuensis]
MPVNTQFIKRTKNTDPSISFFELRKEGIHYIQQLCGHLWTNFNAHDPGLILLETLCYVITELGYKSNFSITDILQSVPNKKFHLHENALYEKQEIFSTHPITLTDYRILLIDQLAPIVNNVWVEAIKNKRQQFTGSYKVWLLADDQIQFNKKDIIQKAEDCMASHRNLGENVQEILFLNRKNAHIHADIQLSNESVPNKMLAAFFYRLEEVFLNPTFKRFTEEELLDKGIPIDEIYNGPKTLHGHFDKNQLKAFPKNIEIEELAQVLFQIDEGVLKVTNFKVYIDGKAYTETIPLDYFLPQFIATDTEHKMHCFQRGIKLEADSSQIELHTTSLKQGQNRNYEIQLQEKTKKELVGTKRDIASLLPINYDLPNIFGLGHQSLPKHSSIEEQQQRQQLESYLQIMNTFLENASKKLSNTSSFFSIYEDSYTAITQQPYTELSKEALNQRNLILDHLLARFNIKFPKYTETQNIKDQLLSRIAVKEKCLQDLPLLTANRSAGANLNKPQWGTSNTAIACKWLHLFLGYPDFELWSLTIPVQLLKINLLKKNRHIKNFPITEILLKGTQAKYYKIEKDRKYFVIWLLLDTTKLYLGKRKTKTKAKNVITTYCETIVKTNYKSKGFYMLENFLVKKNTHFTISLFFPDWTADMQNNSFKEFIKSQAVELLPAHIHATFYALPYDDMQKFETFYQYLEQQKNQLNLNISKKYKGFQF